ncbi:M949_RS01915 family surface polysaccharide biosynthesis protein [Tenacibaculum jejuense]|uniref:M949_RS01915 family surface polysaccharide biosynthesis protein n=1 Tax=Tenacibaculum jejuense TaxID=584609 RepID=UPI0012FD37C1|nr:hypothetical protein [Tenacibaculum jejuense]
MDKIFSSAKKKVLKIKYPIVRVYKYNDRTGENYLVLTERKDIRNSIETKQNDSIQAFNFRLKNGLLKEEWSLRDFIYKDKYIEESSIWFWTKYIEVKDYDGDGFMEPIIIYGTNEEDHGDDRMKILVYHKDEKKAIRHQNSDLDDARTTQVDASVFKMPLLIRKKIKTLLEEIDEKGFTNFNHIYVSSKRRFQFEKEQLLVPQK